MTHSHKLKHGVSLLSTFDKRGKGYAVVEAMKKAKGFAVWIDADGQYDNNEVPKLVDERYDFICGYRDFKSIPFKHRLANEVINAVFNFKFNSDFKDVSCGFVGFSQRFIKEFLRDYSGGGYEVDVMLKAVAIKKEFKINQVPVSVRYFEKSDNLRGLRMVSGILLSLLLLPTLKERVSLRDFYEILQKT